MADTIAAGKLAQDLENVTERALTWLDTVLSAGLDTENSALLRAQSAASGIAINAQLRADALRLRSQREDKALETLMKLIAAKELTTPQATAHGVSESLLPPTGSLAPAQVDHGPSPL